MPKLSVVDVLKQQNIQSLPVARKRSAVWRGPEIDGITFSLLSRYLCCRERFRLLVIEGLRAPDQWNHRIQYGQMWHTCEERLAGAVKGRDYRKDSELMPYILDGLKQYARDLAKQYPIDAPHVEHWYNVCKVQFPVYVEYWSKHPDVRDRKPLLQEHVFNVPYTLPSGRTVRLRGKFDSVDLIGRGREAAVFLQENKTKGDVRPQQLQRQLTFDTQTMMYLVALEAGRYDEPLKRLWPKGAPLRGVRYNVVRRPLSGGKGNIVQHKPSKSNPDGETKEHFYGRLRDEYIAAEPDHFFMRWQVDVYPSDLEKFKTQFLNPVLERLCDWYKWVTTGDPWRPGNVLHDRHPFGVFNILDEGGSTDLDEYLATGSEVGLVRDNALFRELQ